MSDTQWEYDIIMGIRFDFRSQQNRRISWTESETLYKSAKCDHECRVPPRAVGARRKRNFLDSRFALVSRVMLSGPLIHLFCRLDQFPLLSRVQSTFLLGQWLVMEPKWVYDKARLLKSSVVNVPLVSFAAVLRVVTQRFYYYYYFYYA